MVVTGASTGVGSACALALDAQGLRVFAGVRKREAGDALRERASDRLEPVLLDVFDEASIAAAAEHVARALGGAPLRALIYDSYYDTYAGSVMKVRVFDGGLKRLDKIKLMSTGRTFTVTETGKTTIVNRPCDGLPPGEARYH